MGGILPMTESDMTPETIRFTGASARRRRQMDSGAFSHQAKVQMGMCA